MFNCLFIGSSFVKEKFLWFQNGKPPIKITETTTEIEELRSRLDTEKKLRQDVEKELELQVDSSYLYSFFQLNFNSLNMLNIEKWISWKLKLGKWPNNFLWTD